MSESKPRILLVEDEAAIRAGYSARSATAKGKALLRDLEGHPALAAARGAQEAVHETADVFFMALVALARIEESDLGQLRTVAGDGGVERRHHGIAVGLTADLCDPLDVL